MEKDVSLPSLQAISGCSRNVILKVQDGWQAACICTNHSAMHELLMGHVSTLHIVPKTCHGAEKICCMSHAHHAVLDCAAQCEGSCVAAFRQQAVCRGLLSCLSLNSTVGQKGTEAFCVGYRVFSLECRYKLQGGKYA